MGAKKQTNAQPNLARRRFLRYAGIGMVGAGATTLVKNNWIEGFRLAAKALNWLKYGSISRPKYVVNYDFPEGSFDWVDNHTNSILEVLKGYESDLEEIVQKAPSEMELLKRQLQIEKQAHVKKLENADELDYYFERHIAKTAEPDGYEIMLGRLYANIREVSSFIQGFLWHGLDSMSFGSENVGFSEGEAKYGELIAKGREIAYQLTKKQLPSSLSVEYKDLKSNVLGRYNWVFNDIQLRKGPYVRTLLTLLHEEGHAMYLGGESHWANKTEESSIMEEAAAYLFMTVGAQKIIEEQPELGKEVNYEVLEGKTSFLSGYGKGDTEVHAKGWGLADAIARHFKGDYVRASQYLSDKQSLADIDTQILDIYDNFVDILPGLVKKQEMVTARIYTEGFNLLNKYMEILKEFDLEGYRQTLDFQARILSK